MPSESTIVLDVQDVTKSFGRTHALNGVSFQVEEGDTVGFLGRNGAGKTTTLRILAGFYAPTSGRIEVLGHGYEADGEAISARVGYLPERPPLYEDMPVADYLVFCGRLKGLTRARARARLEEMATTFGIEAVIDTHCFKLSQGFRQRVGLAQAFIHEPSLVLLDEPTAGLDPEQTEATRRVIAEQAETTTIVLSSHLLGEVQKTCDRILIIEAGRVVADDTPANLSTRLTPSRTFRCRIRGEARGLLDGLAGVKDVTVSATETQDVHDLEVVLHDDAEVAAETISAFITERGAAIVSFHEEELSLEDIFLQFVRNGDAG